MQVKCCDKPLSIKEYRVLTKEGKKYNHLSEYMIQGNCKTCGKLFVNYLYEDKESNLFSRSYVGGKAHKFLKEILHKEDRFKETFPDYRMYLNYNEHGKVKECRSNLSGLKIGLIDHTEGLEEAYLLCAC